MWTQTVYEILAPPPILSPAIYKPYYPESFFIKMFPTKMKPCKCSANDKKKSERQGKRKKREPKKAKSKSQDCFVTFNPKNETSKFCFLRIPGTHGLWDTLPLPKGKYSYMKLLHCS